MKNFILVSPNYPVFFSHFAKALKEEGFNVLGIGDTPFNEITDELKQNLTEYYYLPNMNNYNEMFKAVAYFSFKYGHIDELESNNEFWLKQDARLRKDFNINGVKIQDIEKYKRKDTMKQYYEQAFVPYAQYTLVENEKNCLDFIARVGYPVFVKPLEGVGAINSYKIENHNDLLNFLSTKDNEVYILEEYIDGQIVTFDGIADKNSNVVVYASHEFPYSNADLVNNKMDGYYYCNCNPETELIMKGKQTIKSFGVKKRCFHLEFFRLNVDKPNLGKKGEYVALEVNMRPGGGHVPELFYNSTNIDYYKVYAEIMDEKPVTLDNNRDLFYTMEAIRRKEKSYAYTEHEILEKYKFNLISNGIYDPLIAEGMGGEFFYIAKFKTLDEAIEFKDYVLKKTDALLDNSNVNNI